MRRGLLGIWLPKLMNLNSTLQEGVLSDDEVLFNASNHMAVTADALDIMRIELSARIKYCLVADHYC